MQEQPFQLLAMLLEKPGVLVTREELHLKLWPETTVDFDHGLNKAISKIREALGDSAENPRFIETVARRGYKCLADVTVVGDEQTSPETGDLVPQQNSEPPVSSSAMPATIISAVGCVLLPGGSFGAWCLYLLSPLSTIVHPSRLRRARDPLHSSASAAKISPTTHRRITSPTA